MAASTSRAMSSTQCATTPSLHALHNTPMKLLFVRVALAAHALRNGAARAFVPSETYKERQAALKQERQRSALRSDPALAAASFLAEVANLGPKLSQVPWETQVQRLEAEFGVDPAAHRSAINRVRRRLQGVRVKSWDCEVRGNLIFCSHPSALRRRSS